MAHVEHKLNGIVEAALNHCMDDEYFLRVMSQDPNIEQNTPDELCAAMESYITDELALKTNN